jgi:biopolymer transport protein ExbD
VETATSDGTGALKLIRFPGYADAHQALVADAETLTTTLDFIPLANQKLKALRDKMGNGIALTPNEQAYLGRIRQVPSLIKLALVEPPAPVIAPLATAPSLAPMQPMVQSPPATPSGPVVPVNIDLQADGSVAVNGISTDLASLKARLLDIAKANPTQPLVLTGRKNVTRDQLKKVIMICHEAKLKVKIAKAPPAPTAPPAAATNPPPSLPMPVAPKVEAPTISPPPPAIVSTSATNAAPMVAPAAPAKKPGPLRAVVRIDGKINFQGATFDLPGFKLKLEKIVEATPDQTIQLKVGKKVSYENFQAALEICHSIPVNHLAIIGTPPTPDSAFSSDAPPVTTNASSPAPTNLPTPSLRMNPYMEAPSTNIPSASPAAPPATNAPPMPGA